MKFYKVTFLKSHPKLAYKAGDEGVISTTYDIQEMIDNGYISSDYTDLKPENPVKKRQTRKRKNN